MIKQLNQQLEGKKTYVVAIVMVVLSGLHAQGYLTDDMYNFVFNILVGAGLVTLRMGMKK